MRILCLASLISIGVDVGTASSDYRAYAWIEGFI
jgi:Ca2+-transporting ATPase/Ca2+ transporting ATPase